MRIDLLPITIALLAGACGASDAEVRDARTSGYQADFAIIYSETLAVMRDLYPSLEEDARIGSIKTRWHPLHIKQAPCADDSQIQGTQQQVTSNGQPTAFQATTAARKFCFIRFDVNVIGGRPWRVRVHAQASAWREGEQPVPLHGADVPAWLEPRREAVEIAIYRRLKKYAVRLKERSPDQAHRRAPAPPVELEKFGAVPKGAAKVIAEVEGAANTRDMSRLRAVMADDFTYSLGDGPSADTAILVWQADPNIVVELGKAVSGGCGQDKKAGQIVCPRAFLDDPSFTGYRAGFREAKGAWRMVFFVAGD